jgi:hypothetical protein
MKRAFFYVYLFFTFVFVSEYVFALTTHIAHSTVPFPTRTAQGEGNYTIQCSWKFKVGNDAPPGGPPGFASFYGDDNFYRQSDHLQVTYLTDNRSFRIDSGAQAWVVAFKSTVNYLSVTKYTHSCNQSCTVEKPDESHHFSTPATLKVKKLVASKPSRQAPTRHSKRGVDDVPHAPADKIESGEFSGVSLVTENGLVPLKWGVPYFHPPEWKTEFNPTRKEMKRLDAIAEEVNNPKTTEARRAALIAKRDAIVKNAQRPKKYISGVVAMKNLPSKEPDWWKECHQRNPEK